MINSQFPFITVAMPVRNEEKFIGGTLKELLQQDYPSDRFEIIVADGESTDETRKVVETIAHNYPQVVLWSNPGRLPSSGRNVGFRRGKGDIFVVIDGHCRINNDHFFRNIIDCFERSGAQCLGRPQPFIIPEEPTMQKAIALARISWLGHSSNSFIHSGNEGFVSPASVGCAYKKEIFEKIGFVDESFDACEDVEFNYRVEKAGFKTFFSPKIAISYYPRETLAGLWKQLIRYGKGRFNFIFKHPEAVNLDIFLPAALVIGIIFGPLFKFINNYFLWIYIAILLLYFSLIVCESIKLGMKNGFGLIAKLIITFPVIHVGLGVGMMSGVWNKISKYLFNKKYGKRFF